MLLREVDRATGILAQFAACFRDAREPARITHPVEALQQSERLHAVMGLEDRVAFGLQLGAEQLQAGEIVVNDEEVPGAFRSPANVVSADSTTVALIGRIQHLPNLSEQRRRGERLVEKGRLRLQHPVSQDGVARVA